MADDDTYQVALSDDQVEAALARLARRETGNRNVPNEQGPGGTPLSTAGGPWQIIDQTWGEGTKLAGVGGQYKRALDAPVEVQHDVAKALYLARGEAPWQASAGKAEAKMADTSTTSTTTDAPPALDTATLDQLMKILQPQQQTMASGPPQSFVSLLGSALGGGSTGAANLSPQEKESSGIRSLLNFGVGLLGKSGYHTTPVTLGEALAAGIQGAQSSMLGTDELAMGQQAASAKMRQENVQKALTYLTGANTAAIQRGELGVNRGKLVVEQQKAALEAQKVQQEIDRQRSLAATVGAPAPGTTVAAPGAPPTTQQQTPQPPLPLPPAPPTGAEPPPNTPVAAPQGGKGEVGGLTPPPGSTAASAILAGMQQARGAAPQGAQTAGPGAPTGGPVLATADDPAAALEQAKATGVPVLVKGGEFQGTSLAATPDGKFTRDLPATMAQQQPQTAVRPPPVVAQPAPTGAAAAPAPGAIVPSVITPPTVGGGMPDRFEDWYRPPAALPPSIQAQLDNADKLSPAQEAVFKRAEQIAIQSGDSTSQVAALNEVAKERAAAIANNQQKAQEAANSFYAEHRKQAGEEYKTLATAAEQRRTDAAKSQLELTQGELAKIATAGNKSRDNLGLIDTMQGFSDALGSGNILLSQLNVPGTGKTGAQLLEMLQVATPEQRSRWAAADGFVATLRKLTMDSRAGQGLGSQSDADMRLMAESLPNLGQDQASRNAILASLRSAYHRQMDYSSEVQRQVAGGKTLGDAQDAADKKLGGLFKQLPPTIDGVSTTAAPKSRAEFLAQGQAIKNWFAENGVEPGTLYKTANGQLKLYKAPSTPSPQTTEQP